jgi:hypothetical protein
MHALKGARIPVTASLTQNTQFPVQTLYPVPESGKMDVRDLPARVVISRAENEGFRPRVI